MGQKHDSATRLGRKLSWDNKNWQDHHHSLIVGTKGVSNGLDLTTSKGINPYVQEHIGLINSIGNLGGFAGPYLMGWLQAHTQSFAVGMGVLLAFQIAAGLLVFTLKKT